MVMAKASLTGNWSLLRDTGNVSALGDSLTQQIKYMHRRKRERKKDLKYLISALYT